MTFHRWLVNEHPWPVVTGLAPHVRTIPDRHREVRTHQRPPSRRLVCTMRASSSREPRVTNPLERCPGIRVPACTRAATERLRPRCRPDSRAASGDLLSESSERARWRIFRTMLVFVPDACWAVGRKSLPVGPINLDGPQNPGSCQRHTIHSPGSQGLQSRHRLPARPSILILILTLILIPPRLPPSSCPDRYSRIVFCSPSSAMCRSMRAFSFSGASSLAVATHFFASSYWPFSARAAA